MTSIATRPVSDQGAKAGFLQRDGQDLYEIRDLDAMDPFLMTLVGDSDLWMYISSAGAFTAGRVEPDRCIFPYETDDRLHELGGLSGPVTLIRFQDGRIWRPFDSRPSPNSPTRVLRRSPVGDLVEFEETDVATGLRLRVEYSLLDSLGVIRRCALDLPDESAPKPIELLDGYRNIMPANVPLVLQQQMSTLVDAYKRSELVAERGPAIFTLEAAISDSPQAKESLRVNSVWHSGLDGAEVMLDGRAVSAFERAETLHSSPVVTGQRGAYLCYSRLSLNPGTRESWMLAADAHLDHAAVVALKQLLATRDNLSTEVSEMLAQERSRLYDLLYAADACQVTSDVSATSAHQSNVLFNSMRGGVPIDGYSVDADDFRRFVKARNSTVAARNESLLDDLGPELSLLTLAESLGSSGDPQLHRIALEYLPLTFGRRHGDPSRPWNRFRIRIRDENGHRVTGYEGNWRDIFQNWEATSRSYPAMLPGVIAKFLNATTPDGYNPYRINEQGIDWEVIEPENPRSSIGYWGDHQIVYLHRLLERCDEMNPSWLTSMARERVFAYAQSPYVFKKFAEIAANPRNSIWFDDELYEDVGTRIATIGGDGGLLLDKHDEPVLVTLLEKLLVPALAKVANFCPGGGIWMNTQRPEWNDANNALAGYGLSMVTLFQLRNYADWCLRLLDRISDEDAQLSSVIRDWCEAANTAMVRSLAALDGPDSVDDEQRWAIMASLGKAAESARERVRQSGLGSPAAIEKASLADFFRLTRHLCDRTIKDSKRPDGLYQSYSVLHIGRERAGVESLSPMLEGQVAALAAGVLTADESIELLDTLFRSELFREDQRTFILYPRSDLPAFLARNRIPEESIAASPLLAAAPDRPQYRLAYRDAAGTGRFHADITSHEALHDRLQELASDPSCAELIKRDNDGTIRAFERTFMHARFTGRSGTMHKFEGLGSVYWHMVSKLLLAVQETVFRTVDSGAQHDQLQRLIAHYRRVREGLGYRKSPAEFGAIPHEPYSHTPWGMGAQQPGMTGQVKEGVLARFGEVGVRFSSGKIEFDTTILDPEEAMPHASVMPVGNMPIPQGAIGFTLCGVPMTVAAGDQDRIEIHRADGTTETHTDRALPSTISSSVFARDGSIRLVSATLRS